LLDRHPSGLVAVEPVKYLVADKASRLRDLMHTT
jgi:hypothetical protein